MHTHVLASKGRNLGVFVTFFLCVAFFAFVVRAQEIEVPQDDTVNIERPLENPVEKNQPQTGNEIDNSTETNSDDIHLDLDTGMTGAPSTSDLRPSPESGAQIDNFNNQTQTEAPLGDQTVEEKEEVPVADEEAQQLIPLFDAVQFSFGEQVSLIFTSEHSFPIIETDVESEVDDSFSEKVVGAIRNVAHSVVDGFSNITETISNHIDEIFSFMKSDSEIQVTSSDNGSTSISEEASSLSTEVPPIENQPADSSVDLTSEDTVSNGVKNIESELNISGGQTESIQTDVPAVVSAPVTQGNKILIDNMPTSAEIQVHNEEELRVSFAVLALTPGKHHITLSILLEDTYYHWEGDIVWGGAILREVRISDVYHVYVTHDSLGESLWFVDMSVSGYEYTLLAGPGMFASTTPITFLNTSIFWLSSNDEAVCEYDILARTMSSQALESNVETPLILTGQEYTLTVTKDALEFTEPIDETPYEHSASF